MGPNFVTTVAIETISLPCKATVLILRSDNLDQSAEAAEMLRPFIAKIDQDVVMGWFASARVDDDWRTGCKRIVRAAMRKKPK